MKFVTTIGLTLIPFVLMLGGLGVLAAIIYYWRRKENKKRRRSPLTRSMLRSPGQSLRANIEDVDLDIDLYFVMLVSIPVIVYAVCISGLYFAGRIDARSEIAVSIIIGVISACICGWLFLGALAKRKKLVLGLEGELATGQELDQLMLHGYRVFHDVPTRWGNIDHVIIGCGGVFSVETKMRQKPSDKDRNWEVTVDYGQELLKFPTWIEKKPFEQARTQQKWLADYLRSALSDGSKVVATIALPGWNVIKTGGRWSVPVFNPRNPQGFFETISDGSLPIETVNRIAERLEELCRDVDPSYGIKKE